MRYLHLSVIQERVREEAAQTPLADVDLADVYVQWLDTASRVGPGSRCGR